jgi:hypothetical protein
MALSTVFGFIKGIFKPATELVDSLHTSKEEKLKLVNELARLEFGMQEKVLNYETRILELQASAINTEAKGESWLQRSWRPITMLTFLVMILCNSFGLFEIQLSENVWTLLEFGLGGYVVGRTLEKVATQFKEPLNKILTNKKNK